MRVSGRPDQLFIRELSNSKLGQFATEAGVLYSAKRKIRSGPCRLIDKDHACVDLACDPLSAFYIFGNHRSANAVRTPIGTFRNCPPVKGSVWVAVSVNSLMTRPPLLKMVLPRLSDSVTRSHTFT